MIYVLVFSILFHIISISGGKIFLLDMHNFINCLTQRLSVLLPHVKRHGLHRRSRLQVPILLPIAVTFPYFSVIPMQPVATHGYSASKR
jgi:hypothetical protein